MKNACGIIAVTAIALSAPQFASAQTLDRAGQTADNPQPRAADQSASARDEVKARLEGAGFTDVQIVSESFLVRAIGPDGDPVMMVVRPTPRGIVPDESDDQGEADARRLGDPDVLGDALEDGAEEEAVAPTPRNGHIGKSSRLGKSSKLMDRAPTEESAQPPEANQGNAKADPGNAKADQGNGMSATMSGPQQAPQVARQDKSDRAPDWHARESGRLRDEGLRESAEQTMPGRPDGVPADVKQSEQHALKLDTAQRAEIWKQLGAQQATNVPAGFRPQIGATVPGSLPLKSLPNSVSSEVPQVQPFQYAMVQSQLLIVDPATKKIVSIITE